MNRKWNSSILGHFKKLRKCYHMTKSSFTCFLGHFMIPRVIEQNFGIISNAKRFRIQINLVLRLSKCGLNGSKNSNCKTRLASKSFWYDQNKRYHLISFKSINYGRLVSLNLSHSIFTPWIISKLGEIQWFGMAWAAESAPTHAGRDHLDSINKSP